MTEAVLKVLVVDDDPANVELLRTRLGSLGCETLVAKTAEEGLRLVNEDRPDLVLLDLRLGYDMTGGLWFLTKLREDDGTTKIPVFIHSIYIAHKGDLPSAEALSDGFLLKPFKFDDLRRIIHGFRAERLEQRR